MSDRFSRVMLVMATVVFVAIASASGVGQGRGGREEVAGCPADAAQFHPCAIQKAKTFNPPRTPDGQVNLQGYWNASTTSGGNNIEEFDPSTNSQLGTRTGPAAKGHVVDPPDGKIPYQPWALAKRDEFRKKYVDPLAQCFAVGVRQPYVSVGFQIQQHANQIVMLNGMAGNRIIPLDNRPHVNQKVRLWMGDSRGHWEGNTLVVDVTNFTDRTWFSVIGDFHSDAVHIVERWTMVDLDTIDFEETIEDPKVFTRPWKMAFPLMRNKQPGFEQLEYACFEDERDLPNFFAIGLKRYLGLGLSNAQ